MKKELNVGLWLIAITVVSIVSAVVITDWHSNALWVIICLVFWSTVVFGAVFVHSARIIGIFRIPLPKDEAKAKAMKLDLDLPLLEENRGEIRERSKALKRIKRLQRDYPEMWELLVEPDDEYLCHDYIYERKKEKEQEESAGFAAVWSTLNANNASNGNSSS